MEIIKNTEAIEAAEKKQQAAEDMLDQLAKGRLMLKKPLMINGEAVKELEFDFDALNAYAFDRCLSKKVDPEANNAYEITPKQAFELFCEAVCVKMPQMSAADIKAQIGPRDKLPAQQRAASFFNLVSREGLKSFSAM